MCEQSERGKSCLGVAATIDGSAEIGNLCRRKSASFVPSRFLPDSYWTPTNNKPSRASGRAGEQVSPTSQYVIVSRSLVRRTRAAPARFASLRNTFQLQRQLRSVSSDGEDTDTRAEDFLRGFFSERESSRAGRAIAW